jgi:hypothetical protein
MPDAKKSPFSEAEKRRNLLAFSLLPLSDKNS